MKQIKYLVEKQAFGVCSWMGNKLGIRSSTIRIWFIYVSFLTLGSPVIIYLIMAFFLEHKNYFKFGFKKPSVWDIDQ